LWFLSQKLALEYKVPARLEMARDGRDQPKENGSVSFAKG